MGLWLPHSPPAAEPPHKKPQTSPYEAWGFFHGHADLEILLIARHAILIRPKTARSVEHVAAISD